MAEDSYFFAENFDCMEQVQIPLNQLWPSSDRFLLAGLLSAGSRADFGYNLCLWLTILVPTVFFFVLPAPIVWIDVSPAIVAIVAGLVIITIGLFLIVSDGDPGFIPRKDIQILLNIQDDVRRVLGVPVPELASPEKVYLRRDGRTLQIENMFNDETLITEEMRIQGYKYCTTCRIVRPPRASHCSDCGHCCLRHDHHCPFIRNCVGQRNYLSFVSFVISAIALGVMILFSIILWVADGNSPSLSSPIVVIVVGCVVGLPVAAMLLFGIVFFSYHIYLSSTGQTTREHLRGRGFGQDLSSTSAHPSLFATSMFSSRPPRLYPALRTRVKVLMQVSNPVTV